MGRLPILGGDADRNIGSPERNSGSGSTVAYEVERMRSESSAPPTDYQSGSLQVAISVALIVIGAIVIFEIHRVRRQDALASQATDLAETFIHSSPVVEEDLGSVQLAKETGEQHRSNPPPGWYVNFNVFGKRRSGVVEMRLRNVNGQWLVPSALLMIGHREPVNLR
jgi:hypothetical protein